MKYLILLTLLFTAGCGQLIIDRPDGSRLKINTCLTSTSLTGLYYDPNDSNGFFEVRDYRHADLEFEFDPTTRTFKLKAEGK